MQRGFGVLASVEIFALYTTPECFALLMLTRIVSFRLWSFVDHWVVRRPLWIFLRRCLPGHNVQPRVRLKMVMILLKEVKKEQED